jgi:hypothetical protein
VRQISPLGIIVIVAGIVIAVPLIVVVVALFAT